MSSSPRAPRVFISYSHDSDEHSRRVLGVSKQLRSEGIDARLDRYEAFPAEGWPRWMQRQIEDADFVLPICTETYRRRFEGQEERGKGQGATFEGLVSTQLLYADDMRNRKIVPVLLQGADAKAVPLVLQAYARFKLPAEYDALYRVLTAQPDVPAPALGPLRRLEALEVLEPASKGLPPPENVLTGEPDLSGTWRHAGILGLGQRLHLTRLKPYTYSFEELFFGSESGSGHAFFDHDEWLHVQGVNTLAGRYSGRLRLVKRSLIGEIMGPKILSIFGNVKLDRLPE